MSTDEYTPNEDQVRLNHQRARTIEVGIREAGAEFDRFLARVRRDAAREALIEFRRTELALIPSDSDEDDPIRTRQQALAWRIEMHLLGKHPEESP